MATDPRDLPDDLQRWTAKRRVALVLTILRGETSAAEAARKHGLTVAEVEDWKEKFLLGAENALRSKPRDDEAEDTVPRRIPYGVSCAGSHRSARG